MQLLLHKQFLIYKRSPRSLVVMMLCPLIMMLLIHNFNNQLDVMRATDYKRGETVDPGMIPHCWGESCVTVGYSIIGESDPEKQDQYNWIDEIMEYVAIQNNFEFNKDVKKLTVGPPDRFIDYFKVNDNTTRYAIVWCTDKWKVSEKFPVDIPCSFEERDSELIFYTIWMNETQTPNYFMKPFQRPNPKDPYLIKLQNSVDNGIIKYLHRRGDDTSLPVPKIKTQLNDYPVPVDRMFNAMDVTGMYGSYILNISPMLLFMFILQELGREKELRLRQGLNTVGVSHFAYWLSKFIAASILNFMQVMILMASAYLTKN